MLVCIFYIITLPLIWYFFGVDLPLLQCHNLVMKLIPQNSSSYFVVNYFSLKCVIRFVLCMGSVSWEEDTKVRNRHEASDTGLLQSPINILILIFPINILVRLLLYCVFLHHGGCRLQFQLCPHFPVLEEWVYYLLQQVNKSPVKYSPHLLPKKTCQDLENDHADTECDLRSQSSFSKPSEDGFNCHPCPAKKMCPQNSECDLTFTDAIKDLNKKSSWISVGSTYIDSSPYKRQKGRKHTERYREDRQTKAETESIWPRLPQTGQAMPGTTRSTQRERRILL